MNQKKAIVIGCGIAGLATAIRLSAKGFKVQVHEKNSYPGGKLSHFEREGFQFDAGPSLFTQPEQVTSLFELCGEKAETYFTYTRAEVACKYFFESGKTVSAYAKPEDFAQEIAVKLGENQNQVLQYLLTSKIRRLFKLPFSKIVRAIRSTKLAFLFSSLSSYNESQFESPETVQIFNRFATYNGSNPYKAPAMLSMIPHLEQNEGTFYPFGGMINITNALYLLALKQNIDFVFNSNVTAIHVEGKQAKSIKANDKEIEADLIVSNMDVYYTYKYLLNEELKAKNILKQERSSSAIIFYWGMNTSFSELGLHNIFFTQDYSKEFGAIFDKKEMYDDPTIYINITSKMEDNQAPKGCENWFVMVNAPHDIGQNWEELRASCKTNVIQKLNRILKTNIAQHIQTEDFLDPPAIDSKTSSYTGSLYGTSSNSKFAAFLRHPNQSKNIDNLYFVGGSVHPGGGIPLCLRSAKIVSDLIL
jgi:phytoene desaturase